jgi:hypothetical protein
MNATDHRCDVISALVHRWHRGLLEDVDRDTYEQHLLLCPPCLLQNDKARLAFTALSAAATERPSFGLSSRLFDQVAAATTGAH